MSVDIHTPQCVRHHVYQGREGARSSVRKQVIVGFVSVTRRPVWPTCRVVKLVVASRRGSRLTPSFEHNKLLFAVAVEQSLHTAAGFLLTVTQSNQPVLNMASCACFIPSSAEGFRHHG